MLWKLLIVCVLCLPGLIFAYDSVVRTPETPFELIPILDPTISQEFFGKLDNFPHVYEFVVKQPLSFKAHIYTSKRSPTTNDISILLVKEVTRGVTEIEKTHGQERSNDTKRDSVLAESFYDGGTIESLLEPGVYKFEVSSPNNEGYYWFVLGEQSPEYSYLDNLRRIFEVKTRFDAPAFSAVFSKLIGVPLLLIGPLYYGWRFYKRKYA